MANPWNNNLDDFDCQIGKLIQEARSYPRGSLERNKRLNQIVSLMQKSGKIMKSYGNINFHDYQEALQKSWKYFCGNLCEATTAKEAYNPDKGSVFTWFNSYLKFAIIEILKKNQQEYDNRISPVISPETGEIIYPWENLAAPSENSHSLLKEIKEWLEENRERLSQIHVDKHPDINCYVLILRRLPPETAWKILANEFGVSIPTLSSFYQRKCLPKLQDFGKSHFAEIF
ncbi:hypothetical protein NIES593_02445 [Hydrococcus rivularis NIES-593]|uniref:Sigma-70 family RNA polymerase sigma factor n=1 Tax=Hydrococcus rivularis NIES-593 TaxID=1921803 RepID=A0A1U7HR08_9CYAN|nr:hypothetical protein [Hydrococcus rivularis]OKH25965.1 hypothetical protein NIES593_02445 [Hydrococcus rivularis NIES-593]